MAKITYDDKVALNEEPSVAEINKVTDANMNEIKSSVNNIYDNGIVNKGTLEDNTDLNNLTEEGIYYTTNATLLNAPSINYSWGEIIVINQTVIQQIFIKPTGGVIQIREYSGYPGTWSTWKIVSDTQINDLYNLVKNTQDVTSIGDWNNIGDNCGFYRGNSMSNSPTGDTVSPGWWYVIQIVHDSTYKRQIAFSYRRGNLSIYNRGKEAGTWGSWNADVESGSNTDGRYVKYSDGTMICWGQVARTLNITNSFDNFYYSGISNISFPATFTIAPTITVTPVTGSGLYMCCVSTLTTSLWGGFMFASASHANVSTTINYIAIGRWK